MNRHGPVWGASLLLLLGGGACSGYESGAVTRERPAELVGRWLRYEGTQPVKDTLDFRRDGTVTITPASAKVKGWWEVRRRGRLTQLCMRDEKEGGCNTFHVTPDELVLDEGPYGQVHFARVGPSALPAVNPRS